MTAACNARSSWFDWCTEDAGHGGPHRDQEHGVEWVGDEKPRDIRQPANGSYALSEEE